jgi:predicted DNA-binding protein (MmcQ/YjbR family)
MAKKASRKPGEDSLERLTRLALALPEGRAESFGDHTSFKVRAKVFGYWLDNHHGDGRRALVVKAAPGDGEFLVVSEPERFYRPAYLAKSGWVSLALDRGPIDWGRAEALLRASYRLQAPKTLARQVPP